MSNGKNQEMSCCGTAKKVVADGDKKKYIAYNATKLVVNLILLIASFLLAHFADEVYKDVPHWVMLFSPAWVTIIWCGYPIFKGAFINLSRKKITSSLLISVAMISSVVLEFFVVLGGIESDGHAGHDYLFAAGEIAFLMTIGELIEDVTVKKARRGVEELITMAPKTALKKLADGTSIEVPVEEIAIGDVVIVKPDEQVSVDGEVVYGASAVDESGITGEYLPKDKVVGDEVFAGTRNGYGLMEIKATRNVENSVVMRLIRLTEESERNKAPIARIADRLAGYIVPTAISLAVIVFFVATFALKAGYVQGLIRAVTVLVVFCPCSLALATPTAIAAGLGNASKKGVLIKSGQALELLASVKSVGFDKTGTLTTGSIAVERVVCDCDEEYFKALCASVESASNHPIGIAVSRISDKRYPISDIENILGTGIKGVADGKSVEIVKYKDSGVERKDIDEVIENGLSVVVVKLDGEYAGYIVLSDTVRDSAAGAVEELKKVGLTTFIVTGDNRRTAENVASRLNIDEVYSEQLPHEKLEKIASKHEQGRVAFVGDGANDAPALSTADVGIAIGAIGNAVAMDVADICLMESDLKKVSSVIALSRRVMNVIKFNVSLAMLINLVAVILSTFGILNPVLGALVHNCSSVFVCTNSALIMTYKNKR